MQNQSQPQLIRPTFTLHDLIQQILLLLLLLLLFGLFVICVFICVLFNVLCNLLVCCAGSVTGHLAVDLAH